MHDLSVFAAVRDMKEVLAFVASEEVKGSRGAYEQKQLLAG